MEEVVKNIGRMVLYGIAASLTAVLVVSTFKSGGAIHEAVRSFMDSICG